jgi:hypothetical protein
MARFAGGWRTATAGSTTLPIASLYATAAVSPLIYEIGVFNTAAVAVDVAVRRLTSTGTQGTGRDEIYVDDNAATAVATLFDSHTVGPTITAGSVRVGTLGASVGSGVIFTFGERGLRIPSGTTNGVGIVPLTTGQICTIYIEWSE